MEVGMVQKVDIDDEMQQAYLDYAMSVIVARALPDARDGLKPVHRRILYAMYDMGMRPDSPYKKSARIVGEVLGKYHPHGDMAVYDAMARMAQDFSLRYLLVDGQGNFGSIDGDPPAAMRYTEARLQSAALQMLADIQKNTVDFEDNFDGTLREPSVLPSAIPNFLVNGATGIAVGMSTSVPPHNLGEVVGALGYMLENWDKLDDIELDKLMEFVQGPDFPTGGVIIQEPEDDGLRSAYGTGRGRVTVQARVHLEEMDRGRSRIIVTELPYMTNKASLIERIASLVREERLEGIADLRDESDRHGMRIVIELSKTADPEKVLRDLYRTTPMKSTFSIILLALVDGEPRLLGLKQALRVYLEHRLEIVRRRSEHDLEKARHRAHILEGLRVALKNLDAIINLIRKAPDVETARERLMKQYKLTDIQAQAILDMQLRRLAALERKKIEEEYKEVQALIKELESLLRSPKRMRQAVNDELQAVKEAYGDPRRTYILRLKEGESKVSLLTSRDLTPEKNIWIAVTPEGLISRSQNDKLPRLSGKEAPAFLVRASSRDILYMANEEGETAAIAVHTLPEAETPESGLPFWKVSALREGMRLAGVFTWPARSETETERFLLTVTRQGMVKKTAISELPGPSSGLFTLVKVNNGDRLGWMRISQGQDEVLLVTRQGMSIRFSEEEVRPMGWVAAGVMGMKLQGDDEVAGMELLPKDGDVFLIASDGSAKRVGLDEFPKQGRYGQGIVAWKLPSGATVSGITVGKGTARAIVHLDGLAAKSLRLDEAPVLGRTSRGKSLPDFKAGVQVVGLAVPWERPGLAASEPETPIDSPNGSTGKKGSSRSAAATRKSAKAEVNGAEKGAKSGAKGASTKSGTKSAAPKAAPAKASTAKSTVKSAAAKEAPAKGNAKKAAGAKAASTKATSAKASEAAAATPKLTKAKGSAAKVAEPAGSAKKTGKAAAKAESPAASGKKEAAKPAAKSAAAKPAAKSAAAKSAEKNAPAKPAKAAPAGPAKKPAAKKSTPKQLTLPTEGETPPAEQPAAKKPRAKKKDQG